jgi:hypothetical protein
LAVRFTSCERVLYLAGKISPQTQYKTGMQLKQYPYLRALKRVDAAQCRGYTHCNPASLFCLVSALAHNVEVKNWTILSATKKKC